MVEHPGYEMTSAALILSHSVFIGMYVQYIALADSSGHWAFVFGNYFLTACVLVEVGLKALAQRRDFIFGGERHWNLFDCSLARARVGAQSGLGPDPGWGPYGPLWAHMGPPGQVRT